MGVMDEIASFICAKSLETYSRVVFTSLCPKTSWTFLIWVLLDKSDASLWRNLCEEIDTFDLSDKFRKKPDSCSSVIFFPLYLSLNKVILKTCLPLRSLFLYPWIFWDLFFNSFNRGSKFSWIGISHSLPVLLFSLRSLIIYSSSLKSSQVKPVRALRWMIRFSGVSCVLIILIAPSAGQRLVILLWMLIDHLWCWVYRVNYS